jgi:hypothetical protein
MRRDFRKKDERQWEVEHDPGRSFFPFFLGVRFRFLERTFEAGCKNDVQWFRYLFVACFNSGL